MTKAMHAKPKNGRTITKFIVLYSRGVVSDSTSVTREVTRTGGRKLGLTSTVEMLKCTEREKYAVVNVWGFWFSYFCKLAHAQICKSKRAFSG